MNPWIIVLYKEAAPSISQASLRPAVPGSTAPCAGAAGIASRQRVEPDLSRKVRFVASEFGACGVGLSRQLQVRTLCAFVKTALLPTAPMLVCSRCGLSPYKLARQHVQPSLGLGAPAKCQAVAAGRVTQGSGGWQCLGHGMLMRDRIM